MLAVIRVITLYIINLLLTRGLIPAELAQSLQADSEAMLALELGISAVLTVLAVFIWGWVKKGWARFNRWLDYQLRDWD